MQPMRKQCHLHRSNPRTISSNRDTLSFSVSPAILMALIPLVTPLKPDHEFFLRCAVLSPNLANLSQLVRSNDMNRQHKFLFTDLNPTCIITQQGFSVTKLMCSRNYITTAIYKYKELPLNSLTFLTMRTRFLYKPKYLFPTVTTLPRI